MKITIERAALLQALGHIQSVVERRNTIPILSNVLLDASGGKGGAGKLALTATDMDVAFVETVPAEVSVRLRVLRAISFTPRCASSAAT